MVGMSRCHSDYARVTYRLLNLMLVKIPGSTILSIDLLRRLRSDSGLTLGSLYGSSEI